MTLYFTIIEEENSTLPAAFSFGRRRSPFFEAADAFPRWQTVYGDLD
jgi:hypothetical protein